MPRGVVAGAVAIVVLTPIVLGVTGDTEPARAVAGADAPQVRPDSRPDTAQVRVFLDGVRAANPVQCELGLQTLDLRFGWRRIEVIPDGSLETKELVHWASQRITDPAAVPPLRAALDDADPCVRRVAARLLGRMRHADATASLLGALRSPVARTRELAALGLGFAEDRETVTPLVAALGDDQPSIRAAAAWALGRIESKEAMAALTRVLRNDQDPSVRRAAAWALGAMY